MDTYPALDVLARQYFEHLPRKGTTNELADARRATTSFWRTFRSQLTAPDVPTPPLGDDKVVPEITLAQVFDAIGAVWSYRALNYLVNTSPIEACNWYAVMEFDKEWVDNCGPHKHLAKAMLDIGQRSQRHEQKFLDAVLKVIKPVTFSLRFKEALVPPGGHGHEASSPTA